MTQNPSGYIFDEEIKLVDHLIIISQSQFCVIECHPLALGLNR